MIKTNRGEGAMSVSTTNETLITNESVYNAVLRLMNGYERRIQQLLSMEVDVCENERKIYYTLYSQGGKVYTGYIDYEWFADSDEDDFDEIIDELHEEITTDCAFTANLF